MELLRIDKAGMDYPVGSDIIGAMELIGNIMTKLKNVNYFDEIISQKINIVIWCRGSSGAILAAMLSNAIISQYDYNLITINHVKKQGEESHSTNSFRMNFDAKNIIIDDFIDSGETFNYIIQAYLKSNNQLCTMYNIDIMMNGFNIYDTSEYSIFNSYFDYIGNIIMPSDDCDRIEIEYKKFKQFKQ